MKEREELLTIETKLRKLTLWQLKLIHAFVILLTWRRRLINRLQGKL